MVTRRVYISRHSLHNWELLIGLSTINKLSKKPVRGSDLVFKILFYIKAIFTFIFCGLLTIPVLTHIELIVGEKIEKKENETVLQFVKRCEIGLNEPLSN